MRAVPVKLDQFCQIRYVFKTTFTAPPIWRKGKRSSFDENGKSGRNFGYPHFAALPCVAVGVNIHQHANSVPLDKMFESAAPKVNHF